MYDIFNADVSSIEYIWLKTFPHFPCIFIMFGFFLFLILPAKAMQIDGVISFKYFTCVNNVGTYWVNRSVEQNLACLAQRKWVRGQLLALLHGLHMQSIHLAHWKPRMDIWSGKKAAIIIWISRPRKQKAIHKNSAKSFVWEVQRKITTVYRVGSNCLPCLTNRFQNKHKRNKVFAKQSSKSFRKLN